MDRGEEKKNKNKKKKKKKKKSTKKSVSTAFTQHRPLLFSLIAWANNLLRLIDELNFAVAAHAHSERVARCIALRWRRGS